MRLRPAQGPDGHAVEVPLLNGDVGLLNRYVTSANKPRPESYLEDLTTASHADVRPGERPRVFSEIAAAAESGWDCALRPTEPWPRRASAMAVAAPG